MDSWRDGGKRAKAWDFLLNELKPDIALLQEARLPEVPGYDVLWTSALERGESLKPLTWGSAVLSRVGKPLMRYALAPEDLARRGAVQIASCTISGLGEATIANIHSRLGDKHEVQKVIPNLRETIDLVLATAGPRFIVGGDLNTGRSLGTAYGPKYGHGDFWNETDAGVLKEALPGDNEERQSYWGQGDDNKGPTGNALQDDHVFLDAETFKLVSQSRVWDTPQVRGLSDHGPIVVDLSLTV
jgi:endonuclease/exonuclease/phosphatase family metal-dependent hydrolase